MAFPGDLRVWVRCLQWTWRVIAVAGVLAGGLAALMIITDEAEHDDEWDGLGTVFGLIGGGISIALLVLSGVLLALVRVGWRRVQVDGSMDMLRSAAAVTMLLAIGWLCVTVTVVVNTGSSAAMVATASPSLLMMWFAAMVLTKARKQSPEVLQGLSD